MSYDDRLIIKHHFSLDDKPKVNTIKFVEYTDFVQVYINNGASKYGSIRLDKAALDQIREFMLKVEIKTLTY